MTTYADVVALTLKSAGIEYIFGVPVYFYLIEYLDDLSFFVDKKRLAERAHIFPAVHRFFTPNAVFFHDRPIRIGDKVEWKLEFRDEFLMGFFAVRGYAENFYSLAFKNIVGIAKRAGLFRAAWRVRLGVEEDDRGAFGIDVFEDDLFAVLIDAGDIRRRAIHFFTLAGEQ